MKLLVNQKTKFLFFSVLLLMAIFTLFSAICIKAALNNAAVYVLVLSIAMEIFILVIFYWYLRGQSTIVETAIGQIDDYISGDHDVRISCDEEGELYLLFHKINSLAAILNAHAENERRSKIFMKETISDISHQLKTPLAALNIYNGILQEETEKMPVLKEFTSLSEQELDRIGMLVQNLLKITKLDAGTIMLEKNFENLAEIVYSVEKHFVYQAEQTGKTLSISGDDKVVLLCDRSWLTEAINNIVKNAFDHTNAGDTIEIVWRELASVIQLTIRDNGSGIHAEDLPHIFKRFYRSRFSQDAQGIGLGLSLAKAIIESHGGTIEVDSELGVGTSFTMNFIIPTKL